MPVYGFTLTWLQPSWVVTTMIVPEYNLRLFLHSFPANHKWINLGVICGVHSQTLAGGHRLFSITLRWTRPLESYVEFTVRPWLGDPGSGAPTLQYYLKVNQAHSSQAEATFVPTHNVSLSDPNFRDPSGLAAAQDPASVSRRPSNLPPCSPGFSASFSLCAVGSVFRC